jgi:hypothetical protein
MTDIITNYIVNLEDEVIVHNKPNTAITIDWRGIKKIDITKPIVNVFFLRYDKSYDLFAGGDEEKFKTSFLQEAIKNIEKATDVNSELKYLSFFTQGLMLGRRKQNHFIHSIRYALLFSETFPILKNKCGNDIPLNKESRLYDHLFPKSFNLQVLKDELMIKDIIL